MDREMGKAGAAGEPDAWGAGTDAGQTTSEAGRTATDDATPGTACAECGAIVPEGVPEGSPCPQCGAPLVEPLTRETDAPAPPG